MLYGKMKEQHDKLIVFSWILCQDKVYDILRSQLLGCKDSEYLDQVFSMIQNVLGTLKLKKIPTKLLLCHRELMLQSIIVAKMEVTVMGLEDIVD